MSPWSLGEMTWVEVSALDRARCVSILPIGAIEAHGPHLPLTTDSVIAHSMSLAAAKELEARDITTLLLPPFDYTAAPFAAAFPGTISISADLVESILVDIGRALESWQIRTLAIANAHLDPAHLGALHQACRAIRAETALRVAFPDLTQRPWGSRLTAEFKSGACHAGQFEGSIVLAARPDWVREDIRKSLPANSTSLAQAIQEGRSTFHEAGGPEGYFGDPAAATPAEGQDTIEVLGGILVDSVVEQMDRVDP